MAGKKIILIFTILGLSFLANINCDGHDACPSSPCLNPKPQLQPDQTLEIGVFTNENSSEFIQNLWKNVCKVVDDCKGIVHMLMIPGALTEEKNGKIDCGDYCYDNAYQVCSGILNPKYPTTCGRTKRPDWFSMESCINEGRADPIMIANGKLRKEKGIPPCKLPTLTFNGIYDLCVKRDTYEEIKSYVCDLYNHSIDCCPK